jgi:hypothetical protein
LTVAGPALIGAIKRALIAAMAAEGANTLIPLVGRDAAAVARAGPEG